VKNVLCMVGRSVHDERSLRRLCTVFQKATPYDSFKELLTDACA